jgi:hypothetical protein
MSLKAIAVFSKRSLFFHSFQASPTKVLGQSLRNNPEISPEFEKKGIFGYHLFQPLCYSSQSLPISFL